MVAIVIIQVLVLYSMYLAGTWIQNALDLMIPGSIIGMVLLFCLLVTKILPLRWIQEGSRYLLAHLTLFFIPVTVGVMEFSHVFKGKGLLLIPAVLVSTILVMLISGKLLDFFMSKRLRKRSNET
ncbi:CidA/LrgA family protein [Pseudalkalibacillus salsuginis]|uniref:CidA/LrgA family protein n=1 Tax=Pseudalkalibacillus salsuginis TaxID=2910972 RepID=UPI001F4612AF|nr:CidA/LrgA family protein [Pseudalkalibacillus salsuginis]MCF6408841.1 CidA/LrgA family protein [Pseudalkalibacillus salsuginis]